MMSFRLSIIFGATLAAIVALSSIALPNRISAVLLGGAGGLVSGWLVSRNRHRSEQTEMQQTIESMKRQLTALQTQITSLSTELEQVRTRPMSTRTSKKFKTKIDFMPPHVIPQAAIDALAEMGIAVENYWKPKKSVDGMFNQLAMLLGDHYLVLACLHAEIKRALHTKTGIRFSLKGKCPEEIRRCSQLCNLMREMSLIHRYQQTKGQKGIQAEIHYRDDVRYFFDGEWFERYTCLKLSQFFQAQDWHYHGLKSVQVQFPDGKRGELDVFFVVNGEPLWIECKATKQYDSYLKKYADYRDRLGIGHNRALLLILDQDEELRIHHAQLWQLIIGTIDQLVELVDQMLQEPADACSSLINLTSLASSENANQEDCNAVEQV